MSSLSDRPFFSSPVTISCANLRPRIGNINVYKKQSSRFWQFAPTLNIGTSRRQQVINSYLTDKRAATDVMRRTVLLAEAVEA